MELISRNGICWESAPGIAAVHGFPTRLGGVSTAPHLKGLNIGTHRGDEPENVIENYRLLGEAMGFDPRKAVLSRQIHSDIVLPVDAGFAGAGLFAPELPECDALVTDTPGLALTVFTADCTPILLYDPVTGAAGAAHAGWRGTAARIAGKTAQTMCRLYGCRPEDIRAAIGPHIQACCFQTGEEVPEAMEKAYGHRANAAAEQRGDKYYVNLTELNRMALTDVGVTRIETSCLCSKCREDLFWSHRRTGTMRGSQGGIIVGGKR